MVVCDLDLNGTADTGSSPPACDDGSVTDQAAMGGQDSLDDRHGRHIVR